MINVVATIKSWNIAEFEKFKARDTENEWHLITDKSELTAERLRAINPRYVFFPHWSWIIPKEIYEEFECIVFHMTDLPYGRGGSPLQNLIVRGHTETKISALRVGAGMDTGDIYLKRDLSLAGTANEIFRRASAFIFGEMIPYIMANNPVPAPQSGEVVEFARRKPEDGSIAGLDSLSDTYDYIRMLDAEGYPRAFLETDKLRLEFEGAEMGDDEVMAKVRIINKL